MAVKIPFGPGKFGPLDSFKGGFVFF